MCKIEYDTSNEVILTRIKKLEEAIKNGSITISQKNKKELVQKNNNLMNDIENSGNNINKEPKVQENVVHTRNQENNISHVLSFHLFHQHAIPLPCLWNNLIDKPYQTLSTMQHYNLKNTVPVLLFSFHQYHL